MFTGLIEDLGEVVHVERRFGCAKIALRTRLGKDLKLGGSIALNGVCLSVEAFLAGGVEATAVAETLRRSTLGNLRPRMMVNLETPLSVGDPIDGHLVQGHVDGQAVLIRKQRHQERMEIAVEIPEGLDRYVVDKGSIALDGVGLTVAGINRRNVSVSLVPATLLRTTFRDLQIGSKLNLEVDLISKYVSKAISANGAMRRGMLG